MGALLHGFLPSSGSSQLIPAPQVWLFPMQSSIPSSKLHFTYQKFLCSCIKRHRFALKSKQKSLAQPSHPTGSGAIALVI